MKFIVIKLLRIYQGIISPLFHPSCRFEPTCSQYMIDAVEKKVLFGEFAWAYGVY